MPNTRNPAILWSVAQALSKAEQKVATGNSGGMYVDGELDLENVSGSWNNNADLKTTGVYQLLNSPDPELDATSPAGGRVTAMVFAQDKDNDGTAGVPFIVQMSFGDSIKIRSYQPDRSVQPYTYSWSAWKEVGDGSSANIAKMLYDQSTYIGTGDIEHTKTISGSVGGNLFVNDSFDDNGTTVTQLAVVQPETVSVSRETPAQVKGRCQITDSLLVLNPTAYNKGGMGIRPDYNQFIVANTQIVNPTTQVTDDWVYARLTSTNLYSISGNPPSHHFRSYRNLMTANSIELLSSDGSDFLSPIEQLMLLPGSMLVNSSGYSGSYGASAISLTYGTSSLTASTSSISLASSSATLSAEASSILMTAGTASFSAGTAGIGMSNTASGVTSSLVATNSGITLSRSSTGGTLTLSQAPDFVTLEKVTAGTSTCDMAHLAPDTFQMISHYTVGQSSNFDNYIAIKQVDPTAAINPDYSLQVEMRNKTGSATYSGHLRPSELQLNKTGTGGNWAMNLDAVRLLFNDGSMTTTYGINGASRWNGYELSVGTVSSTPNTISLV